MIHQDFISLANSWCQNQSAILIDFIWKAYDQMGKDNPHINTKDLERSITQLIEPRIRNVMTGDEPFYIQHGPYERETMKQPPAQPPQYDLAFILNVDERIMWPIEAKVIETPNNVYQYVNDIRNEFLQCRYSPFSSEGAMLGYLLSGSPTDAFGNISKAVHCVLVDHPSFPSRPQKLSHHRRIIPDKKPYPINFCCHHLMLSFIGLKRQQ